MEKEERERESKNKKKWTTPQLIVLVRGKPEEGVLVICKQIRIGVGGPGSENEDCVKRWAGGQGCIPCFGPSWT